MRDVQQVDSAKRGFIILWLVLTLLKAVLAIRLPLFVDEAFYWQEGQHLAWAYSDLPGLTAWLARLGDTLAPGQVVALRLPFLLLGATIPWVVVRMSGREFGARTGWWTGSLCLLLPLAGSLGVMALPDVPLLLASVLCLDAGLRVLRRVDALATAELALGLAIGGLAHYRFAAVILVGLATLLALREGRRALRSPWLWVAIGVGALAWLPLLWWNLHNADAGLKFQLVDRHPWAFSWGGFELGLMQWLPVTPVLLLVMTVVAVRGLRDARPAARYLAISGMAMVLGFFLLGFFADQQRVSFHWPVPGFVALLPLAALSLMNSRRTLRHITLAVTAIGLLVALGFFAVASVPQWRALAALRGVQSGNFAGWDVLADAIRTQQAHLPAGARVLAGDFKIGAEMGFALGDANLPVLAHPLNEKHGRAVQLSLWNLLHASRDAVGPGPWLLVASPSHAGFDSDRIYQDKLQKQLGPLPAPQVLQVDGGSKRYWLFVLQ
jgi:4-amino-4-deoxy-L-arabinose transferase-like glycosyltransferase